MYFVGTANANADAALQEREAPEHLALESRKDEKYCLHQKGEGTDFVDGGATYRQNGKRSNT